MKTVLIKVPMVMSFVDPSESTTKIQKLRKWCYANTKSPWSTYHIKGLEEPGEDDFRSGFVAFEFDNEKEAMKFKLYVGK